MINWGMKLIKSEKGYFGCCLIDLKKEILKTINKSIKGDNYE